MRDLLDDAEGNFIRSVVLLSLAYIFIIKSIALSKLDL